MYSVRYSTLIIFFTILFVPISSLAQKSAKSDSIGIKALINGIEKYHYNDANKFASLFLDNGLLISSSGVAINGAKNLQKVFSKSYANIYSGEIEMSIEDLEITGNIAAVRGIISETVKSTENSQPIRTDYYYSLLAKNIGGQWKAKWMMGVTKSNN